MNVLLDPNCSSVRPFIARPPTNLTAPSRTLTMRAGAAHTHCQDNFETVELSLILTVLKLSSSLGAKGRELHPAARTRHAGPGDARERGQRRVGGGVHAGGYCGGG